MSQTTPPQPRKRPRQSRSLLLVEAIKEACLRILEEEGPEKLTTQRIADVAGINIASLYQYYPNKEAVIAEVFEQQIEDYIDSARQRFTEIDRLSRISLEETLQAIVDMEVEQLLLLLRMEKDFYRDYRQAFDIHSRVNELTVSLDNPAWEDWFPQFLSYHHAQLRSQDVDTLSRIARHAMSGTLQSILVEQPESLEQQAVKDELATLLLRYLTG